MSAKKPDGEETTASQNSRPWWHDIFYGCLKIGLKFGESYVEALARVLAEDGTKPPPMKRPPSRWPKLNKELRTVLSDVEDEKLTKALSLARNAVQSSFKEGVAYGRGTPGGS